MERIQRGGPPTRAMGAGARMRVPHPLWDGELEFAVRTETRARVIHLGEQRLDLLANVAAEGNRVVVISDARSRITEPMRQALRATGGAWVVRGGDGVLRDGVTGRYLAKAEDVLHDRAGHELDDLAVAYLLPEPASSVQIVATIDARHTTSGVRLGGGVERLAAIAETEARAFDVAEPAATRWDRDALTTRVLDRLPHATRLVVSGDAAHPLSGVLSVRVGDEGLDESFTGLLAVGACSDPVTAHLLHGAADTMLEHVDDAPPRFALLLARRGPHDLLHRPVLEHAPVPLTMMIATSAVRALGLDPTRLADRFDAEIVGHPSAPLVRFDFDRDGDAVPRLASVVSALGGERALERAGVSAEAIDQLAGIATRAREGAARSVSDAS